MAPEYTDGYGIVHYSNPALGVPDGEHSSNSRFFPDGTEQRVHTEWPWTRDGWLVGHADPITDYHGIPIGERELVVWDGEQNVSGIDAQWLSIGVTIPARQDVWQR